MSEKSEVTIRPYAPEDYDAVKAITREVFGPASIDARIEKDICPGRVGWLEVKFVAVDRELESQPEACFVGVLDGQIVGYVTNVINEMIGRGTIANLAVSAAAQGHGLGRKLLNCSIDYFRSRGLLQAKIETLATNDVGNHLYPSVGFQEVVRQVHFAMKL